MRFFFCQSTARGGRVKGGFGSSLFRACRECTHSGTSLGWADPQKIGHPLSTRRARFAGIALLACRPMGDVSAPVGGCDWPVVLPIRIASGPALGRAGGGRVDGLILHRADDAAMMPRHPRRGHQPEAEAGKRASRGPPHARSRRPLGAARAGRVRVAAWNVAGDSPRSSGDGLLRERPPRKSAAGGPHVASVHVCLSLFFSAALKRWWSTALRPWGQAERDGGAGCAGGGRAVTARRCG